MPAKSEARRIIATLLGAIVALGAFLGLGVWDNRAGVVRNETNIGNIDKLLTEIRGDVKKLLEQPNK